MLAQRERNRPNEWDHPAHRTAVVHPRAAHGHVAATTRAVCSLSHVAPHAAIIPPATGDNHSVRVHVRRQPHERGPLDTAAIALVAAVQQRAARQPAPKPPTPPTEDELLSRYAATRHLVRISAADNPYVDALRYGLLNLPSDARKSIKANAPRMQESIPPADSPPNARSSNISDSVLRGWHDDLDAGLAKLLSALGEDGSPSIRIEHAVTLFASVMNSIHNTRK